MSTNKNGLRHKMKLKVNRMKCHNGDKLQLKNDQKNRHKNNQLCAMMMTKILIHNNIFLS